MPTLVPLLLLLLPGAADVDGGIARALAQPKAAERIAALRKLAPQASGSALDRVRLELAGQLLITGEYESAEAEARAVEGSPDPATRARSLNIQGTSWLYRAGYANALELYRRALPLSDDAARITILNNAGNAHYYLGDYGEAWNQYAQAETILKRFAGASKREDEFTTAVNQATILQRLGKDREAMRAYRGLEPKATPDDHIGRGQLLANLGAVYRRLGDPYKALDTYKRALENFDKAQYADGASGAWINIGIAYLAELRDYPSARQAFERALRTVNGRESLQARLYLAETARREGNLELASSGFSAVRDEARSIQAGEEIWKAEFGLGRTVRDPQAARAHFKAALEQIESIRANVRRGSQRRDFLADKREVYDAYIATLGDPAELFEWMERSRARLLQDEIPLRPLAEIQQRLRDGETLLVTSSPEGQTALLLFVRRDRVNLRRLADPGRELSPVLESELASANNSNRLFVVPDRKLASLAWDALRLPASNRLLVEQATVTYLPAASLLRAQPARSSWNAPSLMTVAVPGSGGNDASGIDRDLPPLPGALRETQLTAASFPAGRGLPLVNPSRQEVLVNLPRHPLVHFAAHAVVDPRDASRTRLVLGSSAIYLRDLEGLDLSGLQLAMLSACQTATGEEVAGEGVDSLANAFLRSGARAVVASLTPVSDQASVEFVRGFYHHLAQGQPPAQALREAKLRFLRSGGDLARAEHWASYVLYGDGDSPIASGGAMRRWIVWILCSLLAALAVLGLLRRRNTTAK